MFSAFNTFKMKKLNITILLLTNFAIAQQIFIKDSVNSNAIQFAFVKLYKNGLNLNTLVSDSLGSFIYTEEIDSLEISHLGYLTKKTINNKNFKNIYLTPKITTIETVNVFSKKGKTVTIGTYNKKNNNSSFGKILPFINRATKFIHPKQKACHVRKIKLNIKNTLNKAQISIKVFEIDSSFYFMSIRNNEEIIGQKKIKQIIPGKEIEIENKFFEIAKNVTDSIITFDVSEMGLILPKEGFFLSFTCCIYDTENKQLINVSNKEYPSINTYKSKEENYCFFPKGINNIWLNFGTYIKASRKYYSKSNILVNKNPSIDELSIGIEVVEIE